MPRWAHADTARIGELIELEGVIDVNNPLHHTVDFIKKVRRDHFPQFTEKNFRTNYRNKVREYEFGDVELKGARRRNKEGKNSVCGINIILSLANIPLFPVGEEISLGEVEDAEEEDDANALPNNDDDSTIMPPKKKTTTTTTATAPTAAKKATPLSAAAMKSLPVPTHNIGANHPYALTKQYTEAKEYRIDLVVYLSGSALEQESPSIRIENKTTLRIYPQYNKKLLGSNIPSLLGWDENSARSQAFASIGQDLASSQRFKSDANRRIITGEPQIIELPDGISIKETEPEVTIHPYENGNKVKGHRQFNSILIARLMIDKPWKEVDAGIKTGAVINLLGLSQSSEESPPRRSNKRGGGGGGGGYGGGKQEEKRSKLNPVEEDDEDEEDDD